MKKDFEEKLKKVLEFAEKSPQVRELHRQCLDIRDGRSNSISQKVIDDAFDAFGIIVKEVTNDPDEQLELQKHAVKHYMCNMIRSHGFNITD